jgi:hypothetical protein
MRHDGGPLIVGALEFVPETWEIAVRDWGASDDETRTGCGYCLTRSHIWSLAVAADQFHIERVGALLQHLDDNGFSAPIRGVDWHDVAASHWNDDVRKLGGTAGGSPVGKVCDGVGEGRGTGTGRFKRTGRLLKP